MSISFHSTQSGSTSDYIPYLTSDPVKTDRYMDSDLLDFKLYVKDSGFVRLNRGAYITLNTVTYGTWFSGYVTSSPTLEYFGVDAAGLPAWGYTYQATADDYILNLQPVGFLPNYMNVTMGEILKSVVTILAPGVFDLSNIGSGQLTAQYSVTPQTMFRDIVKTFCEASSYVFYAKNHKLYFVQQDSIPVSLTVDWNSSSFTPSELTLKPSAVPVINQAFVLGELESQTYVNSYFVGDGFTGSFPLISDVFGIDRFTLIQEDFAGSSVNNNAWNLNDPTGSNILLVNGYLNCVGGSGSSSYSTNLQSVFPIPLEGNIRFTHGEWDFLEPSATSTTFGVICGIWTNTTPTSSFSGCLYGLADAYDSLGGHVLNPVVNGALDTSQTVSIDNTKRYVIRTLASFNNMNRVKNTYTYTNSTGVIIPISLPNKGDLVSWQTTVIELDPLTGLITNTTVLSSPDNVLTSSQLYATYIPVASKGLRLTVTGITVSVPLQAYLEHEDKGSSTYTSQLIGPNEIDSLDNTAPVATIVQANTNTNTKSSVSGKPSYNAGQASLTYFKDSTTLKSSTPALGTSVHLSYRAAGYALGKSSDNASILSESQSWGDSGIRSLVKTDMSPRPRTSEECEAAAASIVGDNSYQHYEGTYNVYSQYVANEPVAGSVLKFANVPSTLPAISAEEVNQVVTTLVSSSPVEVFEHQITFGKPDYLRKLIQSVYQPAGIFLPSDASSSPYGVDTSQVGYTFITDVVAPIFTGFDSDFLYYNTNQTATTLGGFELRYTDDSWGVDDGKNLISRVVSGTTFQVARNTRSKVIFLKQYDARNQILYSEDFTQSAWTKVSTSVTDSLGKNPNGDISHISTMVMAFNGSVYQGLVAGVQTGTFSVSLKGTPGNVVRVQVVNGGTLVAFKNITLTGNWQRVSIYGTNVGSVQIFNPGSAQTVQTAFAAFEDTTAETTYCKTKSNTWGAYSRYSSAVHVAYPLIPDPPTTVVDTSDPSSVVVTLIPPPLAADMWGLELRSVAGYGYGASLGTPVLTSGAVTSVPVTDGGKFYNVPVTVIFKGGGGTGASGTAVTSGGVITGITINSGGVNYTSAPTPILAPINYKLLYSQDITTAGAPYTFTDTAPVEPYQYFGFTYNLLKEYSLPGLEEGEQTIPLNIVPAARQVGVVVNSSFNDPLYGNIKSNYVPATFAASLTYNTSADLTVLPVLNVQGTVPVTKYASSEASPSIDDLVIQVDSVNGKLLGGHTYYVCVCGVTSTGALTPASKMLSVYIPSSMSSCKLVMPLIRIPDPSNMVSGKIFIAQDTPQLLAETNTFALPSIIAPNPTGDPTIFTSVTSGVAFTMPPINAISAPAPSMDKVRIKVKEVIHSGVAGATVTSLAANTIRCSSLIDTSDDWSGSIVSVITAFGGANTTLNFLVTSFDRTNGAFSTDTSGVEPSAIITLGSTLIIRSKATIASSTTIGTAGFLNVTNGHTGLTVDETGYLVRIIAGKGKGQVRKIASNTVTTYTVTEPFDITPDNTSCFIVEGYEWQYQQDSLSGLVNTKTTGSASLQIPLDNYKNVVLLIMMLTVTTAGAESPEDSSPISELFMTGNAGAGAFSNIIAPVTIVTAFAKEEDT